MMKYGYLYMKFMTEDMKIVCLGNKDIEVTEETSRRRNDVERTSMRLDGLASRSVRHHNNVMCLLR